MIDQFMNYVGGPLVFLNVILAVVAVLYLLAAAGLWKIFEKAGIQGWKALIPVYSAYLVYKICWRTSMFWAWLAASAFGFFLSYAGGFFSYLAIALTIVASVISAVVFYNLSLAFGHGLGYFLGLYLFSPVFLIIIGFGSSEYRGYIYKDAR